MKRLGYKTELKIIGPGQTQWCSHPTYVGGRNKEDRGWRTGQQKVGEISSQNKPGMEDHAYNPNYIGVISGRITIPSLSRQKHKILSEK
jgi:hypothetical protein